MMSSCSSGRRGTLFLVVGPSGAGKDSLIAGVRAVLLPAGTHMFPRRVVTRPAEAGGEDHVAVDAHTFAAWRDAGRFALHWSAHGLDYGVPREIETALAAGRAVVVNVSRTVVDPARIGFAPVVVVMVTAPPEVLARRLADRGRETEADMAARLARTAPLPPPGPDVVTVVNDGPLDAGIRRLLDVLTTPRPQLMREGD